MSNISYYNLTGGLNTVQGIGTINQTPKRTESPDMQNVEYHKLGGVQSMLGNKLFGDSDFGSRVTLGYEYVYLNNKYMVICTADGNVRIYNPVSGQFDIIYKFTSQSQRHSICAFNNGIVISNGIDDLVYYQRGRRQLLSGTVNVTANSTTVTGSETSFTTELKVGDRIEFGEDNTAYEVTEITSDTQLTIATAPTEAVVDSLFYLGEISLCHATLTNSEDENINTPIRGLAMNSYQGRIFVGATDGTLYYSAVGLYNNWDIASDAGGIATFYNDNSDFTALAIWDKYLVLCKRERSYLLDGTNNDSAQWVIQPYSIYTCDSQQSWIDCNGGLYVYSRVGGGIYPMLQRTIYSPNYQGNELSSKIKDSFNYINTALYDYIFPVYHPKKMYLMFYIPMLTGIGSNVAYVYDLLTKSWLLRKVPQNVTVAFRFEEEIYIGTQDGHIYKEFSGLTFAGEPIEFWWKSPWLSFGRGTDYLSTREFRIKISEEQTNKFYVRNYRDGRGQYKSRIIDSSRGAFTGLVWDIGYNPNEQNPDYTSKKPCYPIVNNFDGQTYYTDVLLTNVNGFPVRNDVPIYSDENCTERIGYTNLLYGEYSTDDPEIADRIERVPVEGYRWEYSYLEYVRYTNGTDYLWVYYQDGHPQVGRPCKISKQASTTTTMYAYAVYTTQSNYYTVYLNVDDTAFQIHNGIGAYYARKADGSNEGTLLFFHNNNKQDPYIATSGSMIYSFVRDSSRDIKEATGTDTGSNIDEATSTTITTATETTDDVWTVTAGGVTFTNLSNVVSDGETISGKLYSKTNTITNGTDLYGNPECTFHAAEGREPSGDRNVVLLDGFERQVYISGGTNYDFFDYLYWVQFPITYNYKQTNSELSLAYQGYAYQNICLYDPDDSTNYILINFTNLQQPKVGDTVTVHQGENISEEQIVSISGLDTANVTLVTNNTTYEYVQYESGGAHLESEQINIYINDNKAYLDIDLKKYLGDISDGIIKQSWCYQRLGRYNTNYVIDVITIDDPSKIQLPDLSDYVSQSITDTVWDTDAWVVTNHIIKRFPLPDQYFNTLQIELYGNATDEAMAVYGFEIDGVELEEVPYR